MPRTLPVPDVVAPRLVRVAVAVVLAVGLLGGCSSGGSAPVPTSASPAATVTASPAPTLAATPSPTTTPKPVRPAAMDTVDVDGAIATAEYFLRSEPYVANTGDLVEWRAMSHPDCVFCAGVTTEVTRMFSLGHHQEGTETTILSATGIEVNPGVYFQVNFEVTQGAATEVDSAGAVVDAQPLTATYDIAVAVVRENDQWLIREVQTDIKHD